jgi:leader peptidase (prepilin peptidase) / N-methyltransferase
LTKIMEKVGDLISLLAALGILIFSFSALPLSLALVSCLLGWVMLGIAVADAKRFIIPDVLSLPAIPLGLLVSGRFFDASGPAVASIDHAIGMICGGIGLWLVRAAYFRVRRREGLGLGDVKLAAAAGAWLGWQNLSDVFLFAAALALSVVAVQSIIRGKPLSAALRIPFGCFLAPSIWLAWVHEAYGRTS